MGITGKGGMRIGAGRKSKSLSKKIYDGQAPIKNKKKKGKKQEIEIIGADMPKPDEFLLARQKNGVSFKAEEIYKDMWQWVCSMGCEKQINKQLVEQYAVDRARWIQCQEALSQYGFIAKHPTTGHPTHSPFVAIGTQFEKSMNTAYFLIEKTIRENNAGGIVAYEAKEMEFSNLLD